MARVSGTTQHMLQIPYDMPLSEALIRKLAAYRVTELSKHEDDSFW